MAAKAKWSLSDLPRVGRAALALAQENKAAIEPRLEAGLLDGLAADLDALDGKRAAVPLAREGLREATRNQDGAAQSALEFLSAARGAVSRSGAAAAQRAAFGLKLKLNPGKVSSVVSALEAFIDGAARYPDAARGAGLLTADVDQARALRGALVTADALQEAKKETRKSPTAERLLLQKRVEKSIDSIINAGRLAFITQPAISARFKTLVPGAPKRPAGPVAVPA